MSELSLMLRESIVAMLSQTDGHDMAERRQGLMQAFEATGLGLALVSEAAGGAGLPLADGIDIARHFAGAPLPVASLLLAPLVAAAAGLAPDGRWMVGEARGAETAVPWIADCDGVLILDARRGVVHRLPAGDGTAFADIAGQPWLAVGAPTDAGTGIGPEVAGSLARLAAMLTAASTLGAMRAAIDLSVGHANMRSQFGKPIARFQAVQQRLAEASLELRAAAAAVDWAAALIDAGTCQPLDWLAAKAQSSIAAGVVAAHCHQVCGAMGYTEEFALHHLTRQLWAWRSEWGGEADCARRIAELAIEAGEAGLWPLIADGR